MSATTKIPKKNRKFLYFIVTLSWVTGICFFIFNQFITVEGDFGPQKHPFQFRIAQLHGLAAFFMVMAFGYLMTSHVRHSWKVKPVSKLGIAVTIIHGFLILTAYLLYYIVTDASHAIVGYFHFTAGLIYPLILFLHIKINRIERKQRRRSKLQTA